MWVCSKYGNEKTKSEGGPASARRLDGLHAASQRVNTWKLIGMKICYGILTRQPDLMERGEVPLNNKSFEYKK